MIAHSTIERIQLASQIYEVVSDFIALQKRGVNYVGLCPFHEDNTPSLYVSPAKNIYKCFACGEGGTPIHFIMKHEQLSYPEALKYLARKYGIMIYELDKINEQVQIQDDYKAMFILNNFAQKTFSSNLFETKEGNLLGLSYFKKRNFKENIIQKFQLGYADSQCDSFSQKALKTGYKQKYLEKNGLSIINKNNNIIDRFNGRIIFPIHTLSGKIIAFGGRILKEGKEEAKYINSPESEIYCKSNELYGIYFARQEIIKQNNCYLVEGYSDVISMFQAGIKNVVSSCGTSLTNKQIQLIRRFTENVTIIYDGDIAGVKATSRSINLLLAACLNIKIVLLPKDEDPDSFILKQSANSFKEYIKNNEIDFIQFKLNPLINDVKDDPIHKVRVITEIIDTIALIPKEIVRLIYIKECSYLVGIDEHTIIHDVTNKRRKFFLQKNKNERLQFLTEKQKNDHDGSSTLLLNQSHNNSPFHEYEKEIMYYVIRYGEQYFHYKYTDKKTNKSEWIGINVIEFIVFDLEKDKMKLHHPLYRKILKAGYTKWRNENFVAENYFKHHPDIEISRFAANISTDKYIESKIHSKYNEIDDECTEITKHSGKNKMLLKEVPYVVLNYKNSILKYHIEIINKQIKLAEQENNFNKQIKLIQQLNKLLEPQKNIAVLLHERIITNYNSKVFSSMLASSNTGYNENT
ncbi:MAG: DNA primase [Bacteroidales bacterium OttesenSCG-928-I14]|jgi:DNA primase|nr:DNA primase [Bacteroidales bacterium OttesenSCG-928-I14]